MSNEPKPDDNWDGLDELIEQSTAKRNPPADPKQVDKQTDPKDEVPGWAHAMQVQLDNLANRIPEPRATDKSSDPDDDDGIQIVSIEEVKDAVEDAVEKVPEITHSLFRAWGRSKS